MRSVCAYVCVVNTRCSARQQGIIPDSGRIFFVFVYYVLIQNYESLFIFVTLWSYMFFTQCSAPGVV